MAKTAAIKKEKQMKTKENYANLSFKMCESFLLYARVVNNKDFKGILAIFKT